VRADDVTIRLERPVDVAAVRSLLVASFGRDDEADLVDELRESIDFRGDLAFVAVAGDTIVGHVLLSTLRVGSRRAVSLAPLAVAPSWQGRGIGSALVEEALERAADEGEGLVVVLGAPGYYSRFGAVPAANLGLSGGYADAGEEWQAIRLPAYDDSLRGEVVFPAAFSD
jgi:putative acetyltransferase